MSDTLRDQLLGLGFKAPAKPAKPPPRRDERRGRPDERRGGGKRAESVRQDGAARPPGRRDAQGPRKPRPPREDIDLAKAYAIRAQREKDERIEAERQRQEEARLRREARARLEAFVKDKALNRADAEIARHFEYGGKIKRIHVDAEQLRALNAGELGVVQVNGRYLLVTAAVLAEAETIFAQAVALKVDPSAPAGDDPYSDPQYQVPDDLVW
ncbi:DUF2058 family protein [Luteimonas sp. S4-F44]|uniref:DUF2058 domain-containing protein n=1 Tax=Luteimonas sp. S4-F44 TaxID=2925842 RepID=UPI001F52B711|nr:DUF2058 family protein [Luteimonas sp. S4-F44]UNK43803.1 DUF2058 family protein [Luteimonas sp. S4-F44]